MIAMQIIPTHRLLSGTKFRGAHVKQMGQVSTIYVSIVTIISFISDYIWTISLYEALLTRQLSWLKHKNIDQKSQNANKFRDS